jgi:hypothetical protein
MSLLSYRMGGAEERMKSIAPGYRVRSAMCFEPADLWLPAVMRLSWLDREDSTAGQQQAHRQ